MKRMIASLILLLSALLAALAQAPAPDDWTGNWNGTLTTPSMGELRLVVVVVRGADGALTAELASPDQGPGRMPIPQFAIDDGRMRFALPAIRASYEGVWQPAEERFAGTFTQGMALPLNLSRAVAARALIAGLDGRWEGSVTRNGAVLRLILRISTTPEAGTFAQLDSPDLMATNLPVAGLAREGQSVSFAIPAGASRFRGTLSPDGNRLTGIWSRTGSPDAEVSFARAGQAAALPPRRPQNPPPPFSYRVEEVGFDNGRAPGVRLAGTLTLPQGPGPFPAAILISGSGPQDRDEALLGHRPFAVLADRLTRQGITVLRYDDRGIGASTGSYVGATSSDFATDANAAFAFLRGRADIGPIGFVGHSEGGMIGPLAMRDNEDVAFLVMMAGPGTRIPQLMDGQRRAVGRSQGQSEEQLEQGAPLHRDLYAIAASERGDADARTAMRAALDDERMQGGAIPPAGREAIIDQLLDPWFRHFARYDPAPVLARIRVPVLAINGALDRQVVAAENLAGIRVAMAANRDLTVTELPGLNHLFQTARTGGIGEYAEIEETMAPAVPDMIAAWIGARFPCRAE